MTLLIMAAGMGSRFGGLKQIEPVGPNGEFILDYSIYDAIKAGFDKVVIIIKEENLEIFKDTIGHRLENIINVQYAFQKMDDIPIDLKIEREKPWGTGQAILSAKRLINENFAVINSDDFYGRDCFIKMAEFLKNTEENSNHYGLVGYHVANTLGEFGAVKRGVCKEKKGFIETIIESSVERKNNIIEASPLNGNDKMVIHENDLVSMNALCFTKKIFKYLERDFKDFLKNTTNDLLTAEYLIPEEIKDLIRNQECDVKLLKTSAIWHGITYKEDKTALNDAINKLIINEEYPKQLWK